MMLRVRDGRGWHSCAPLSAPIDGRPRSLRELAALGVEAVAFSDVRPRPTSTHTEDSMGKKLLRQPGESRAAFRWRESAALDAQALSGIRVAIDRRTGRRLKPGARQKSLDENIGNADDLKEMAPGAAPPSFDLADMVCPRCKKTFTADGIDHDDEGTPTIACSTCGATYPTTAEHHAALRDGSALDDEPALMGEVSSRNEDGSPRSLFESREFMVAMREQVRKRLRAGSVED